MRGVLVQQNVWQQKAKLVAYREKGPGLVLLPELDLRGTLMVQADGVSLPITLCAPADALDPSPCLPPAAVHLENPVAYLDRGGVFRFVDEMRETDAVALVALHDRFAVPVSVAGRTLTSFVWPLHYERPDNFVASPDLPGAVGPSLVVKVDHRDPARYVFSMSMGAQPYWAVVEAFDARSFVVASQGAQGRTGSSGAAGATGSSGGECASGGPGGSGTAGGPGGEGGDGGDVLVELDCGGRACADAIALLRTTVLSLGGPGGAGGAGGAGGSGGSGGPGRSQRSHIDSSGVTVVDDPGCSPGSSGSSGSSGPNGPSGAPGRPGRVMFRVR